MRYYRFAYPVLVAITASVGFAPLGAQMQQQAEPVRVHEQMALARSACKHSFADQQCAAYQNRLIKIVATEASTSSRISVREVANRQLNGLIASIN